MNEKLAIFGTSGFAYETADVAYALGISDIVLVSNDDEQSNKDQRITIVQESTVGELAIDGYKFAIGIGEPQAREKIYTRYPNYEYPNLIHPTATFGHGQRDVVEKSIGNIITAGVVFTNNIKVGNFGVFNLNCTVGHDCILGNYISVMPSVNISGNVHIKDGVFLGVGAIILQGLGHAKNTVGARSIVGAGAVVTKNVADNITVVGMPAKQFKK